MIVLPAPPAAAPRSATPAESPPEDAASEGGGFAAALEQVREPAHACAEGPARGANATADKAAQKSARNTDFNSRSARHGDGADSADTETAADDAVDSGTPDLASLLPGWAPAPVTATPPAAGAAASADATLAVRAARGQVGVDAQAGTNISLRKGFRSDEVSGSPFIGSATGTQDKHLADAAVRAGLTPERPATPAHGAAMAGKEFAVTAPAPKALADAAATNLAPAAAVLVASMPLQAAAGLASQAPTAAGPTFEARLAAALDSPAFAPALANHVTWLANAGVHQARLTLNPAEMGPLAVQIVVDGTQARVDFSADLAATRAAIEASLPTLAAALHDSGLTLAGGGVSDGQARHGESQRWQAQQAAASETAPAGGRETPALHAAPMHGARGLVDLVA